MRASRAELSPETGGGEFGSLRGYTISGRSTATPPDLAASARVGSACEPLNLATAGRGFHSSHGSRLTATTAAAHDDTRIGAHAHRARARARALGYTSE